MCDIIFSKHVMENGEISHEEKQQLQAESSLQCGGNHCPAACVM
jgi:hypothetical protein